MPSKRVNFVFPSPVPVGNRMPLSAILWTGVSFLSLFLSVIHCSYKNVSERNTGDEVDTSCYGAVAKVAIVKCRTCSAMCSRLRSRGGNMWHNGVWESSGHDSLYHSGQAHVFGGGDEDARSCRSCGFRAWRTCGRALLQMVAVE